MKEEKTYAKIRYPNYDTPYQLKGKVKCFHQISINHPTYFEVKQPDRLDKKLYNVIVLKPFQFKGARFASIDLVFLTEKELREELS